MRGGRLGKGTTLSGFALRRGLEEDYQETDKRWGTVGIVRQRLQGQSNTEDERIEAKYGMGRFGHVEGRILDKAKVRIRERERTENGNVYLMKNSRTRTIRRWPFDTALHDDCGGDHYWCKALQLRPRRYGTGAARLRSYKGPTCPSS